MMDYVIRLARADEHRLLPDIERGANKLLDLSGVPRPPTVINLEFIDAVARAGAVFVATSQPDDCPVGFLLAGFLDRSVYLYHMSVSELHQRRGLGRRLMQEGCDYAAREGMMAVTLSTFVDVPFNGPFFETLGFRKLPRSEWTPALYLLYSRQRSLGLPVDRRAFMRKDLV